MVLASGVEGKDSTKNCDKCKKVEARHDVGIESSTSHCHCPVAPIPESMKDLCKKSWKKDRKVLEANATKSDLEKSLYVSRKRKFDEKAEKEMEDLSKKIGNRNTLLPPSKMLRVFEPRNTKKPGEPKTTKKPGDPKNTEKPGEPGNKKKTGKKKKT